MRALGTVLAFLLAGCAGGLPPPAAEAPDLRGTWSGMWGGVPLTLLVLEQQHGHGDSGLVIGPWQVLGERYPTVSGVLTSAVDGQTVSTRMDGLVADAGGRLVVNLHARSGAGEQRLSLTLVERDRLEGTGESQYAWGPRGRVHLVREARPAS